MEDETRHRDEPEHTDEDKVQKSGKDAGPARKILAAAGIILVTAAVIAGGYSGYVFASSPVTIREPLLEHYHFRMQVLVNGQPENFGQDKYQTGYAKDNCNAVLPDHPIHFHDKKDQMVHIHWEGMTGGQVLKYYGWNFIGGTRGSLGYRFDDGQRFKKVPVHGMILPAIPSDAAFHVYVRDGESYKEKKFDDFTHQDLEQFFGVTSNFPAHKLNQEKRKSLLDTMHHALVPTASAHDGADHNTGTAHGDEAELKKINNLIGDVVIFAQKDKPTDAQIKDRFAKMEPLSDSTCGG
jgi:hypothetical protein